MPNVRGVYEVAIKVRDLKTAEPFYRDVLGLAVRHQTPAFVVFGEAGAPADLPHRQQHPGHEARAVDRVMADRERLALPAEDHLLVGDEATEADRVDADAGRPLAAAAVSHAGRHEQLDLVGGGTFRILA